MKNMSKWVAGTLCAMLLNAAVASGAGQNADIAAGKASMAAGKYAEAREAFATALATEGLSPADKADAQVQIGISYYEEKDYARASAELEKVLKMPGADTMVEKDDGWNNYTPLSEARLRLMKMPGAEQQNALAALFIGSSLTLRGYMPLVVAQLSESAPADRPRIITGQYTRGGTAIEVFWEEGDASGTARGKIASLPWDVVVLETTSLRKADSNQKYGKLFCDYIRSKGIKTVLYESHVTQETANPAAQTKYHEDEMALAKAVQAPIAPVVLAEMYYLQANPTARIGVFYDDWIHPSEAGIYMAAYCIYSTITGYSPAGLPHPGSVTDADAKMMQEAAWKAVQEANPGLKPWTAPHGK